jgi:hypothetical protein
MDKVRIKISLTHGDETRNLQGNVDVLGRNALLDEPISARTPPPLSVLYAPRDRSEVADFIRKIANQIEGI